MKYIIGNWKMNPASLDEAVELAKATDIEGYVMCPPFVYLEEISKLLTHAKLGAQDVFFESSTGAYTGEISIDQLKDLGVKYVIVGHSERRALGEVDEDIAKKLKIVLENNLTPVLCVGEKKADRDTGRERNVVKKQLEIDLYFVNQIKNEQPLIIAYEPIWAISGGDAKHPPAQPKDAIEMINAIKEETAHITRPIHVLYGGSVNGDNAKDFLKHKEIEGALPGGASLKPDHVKRIVDASST